MGSSTATAETGWRVARLSWRTRTAGWSYCIGPMRNTRSSTCLRCLSRPQSESVQEGFNDGPQRFQTRRCQAFPAKWHGGSDDASRGPGVLLASYSWGATAVVPSADHHAFVIRCLTRVYHNSPERVSFVDCLVMAYARLYDTREIFGFDAVFVRMVTLTRQSRETSSMSRRTPPATTFLYDTLSRNTVSWAKNSQSTLNLDRLLPSKFVKLGLSTASVDN